MTLSITKLASSHYQLRHRSRVRNGHCHYQTHCYGFHLHTLLRFIHRYLMRLSGCCYATKLVCATLSLVAVCLSLAVSILINFLPTSTNNVSLSLTLGICHACIRCRRERCRNRISQFHISVILKGQVVLTMEILSH